MLGFYLLNNVLSIGEYMKAQTKQRLTKTAIRRWRKLVKDAAPDVKQKINNWLIKCKRKPRPLVLSDNIRAHLAVNQKPKTTRIELHSRVGGFIKAYDNAKSANAAKSAYSRKYGGSHNLFLVGA
jgi:hypothetical protein